MAREEGARPTPSAGPAGEASALDAEGREERRRRFHCRACDTHVADHADLFTATGAEGPGFFVNPAGRFFEVLTLRRARSVAVAGKPTLEATWFDGYAWQFAICARCTAHLGWRYVAVAGAEPPTFYGLIRDALVERDEGGARL
ncbi:MAG TPA: cereblon family protein [Polyangiaceae bacterium]|nr:cereblon family protein [Polyangiaceae bacterium]